MTIKPIKVLLIEDNLGDFELILRMLDKSENVKFELSHTQKLGSGLRLLEMNKFDIILLDLGLPDCEGLNSFKVIAKSGPCM